MEIKLANIVCSNHYATRFFSFYITKKYIIIIIVRFSYDPEPEAEEELSIQAGDYLLVWGEPIGPGGYLDAELLDGRRGLVPSHFAQRLIGTPLKIFFVSHYNITIR